MGINASRCITSDANSQLLEDKDLSDATCPRDPSGVTRQHKHDDVFGI